MKLFNTQRFLLLCFIGFFLNLYTDKLHSQETLTPVGAERFASSDGRIPVWEGGLLSAPKGWKMEQGYIDPFSDDKPIKIVTQQNQSLFSEVLPGGLQELLRRYPQFRMTVYPTRRSVGYSQEILNRFSENRGRAWLDENGGVRDAKAGSIPFREPKNGLEVMWNVLLRFQGDSIERWARAYPVRANGESYAIQYWSQRVFAANLEGAASGLSYVALGGFEGPVSLKGKIALIHEPINTVAEPRAAWIYDPAQRRVRKAPDLAYDATPEASEGMFTADQVDGFSGAPDRFDWKLIGKRSMLVPYNTYAIAAPDVSATRLLHKGSVNPDLMRYELHRVWIIEGVLKAGKRHLYGKRRFYIDEDSWAVLVEEAYSLRGDLWRVALHGLVQYYDAQVPGVRVSIYHDLVSRGYFVSGLDTQRQPSIRFGKSANFAEFTPDALRRLGAVR